MIALRYLYTWFRDVGRLRSFGSLNNFKFDGIPLVQAPITIARYRRIVYEHIRTVIAPDEAISFRIIEPLHDSLHFRRTSCSGDWLSRFLQTASQGEGLAAQKI
jgi:hypothetical protein